MMAFQISKFDKEIEVEWPLVLEMEMSPVSVLKCHLTEMSPVPVPVL